MRKLKIQVDDLRVESFTTVKATEARGTVQGREHSSCGEVCSCDCGSNFGDCGGLFVAAVVG